MESVQSQILVRMRRGPTKVHIGKDFLDLGSRSAVDLALYRLAKNNVIQRVGRGLYYIPRVNPRLGIEWVPDIQEIALALARQTGSRAVPSGAVAANSLGLSTQVPARPVYLTDGRTRRVRVGNTVISFRHVSPKDLPLGSVMTVLVFQALRHLGQKDMGAETIERIRRRLLPVDRRRLLKETHHVTDWVAAIVRNICIDEKIPNGTRHG